MSEAITFTAAVAKVATLADGGIRVTLDLDEGAVMVMAQLAECRRAGAVLKIEATPILINSQDQHSAISEGPKRKPEWQAPKG